MPNASLTIDGTEVIKKENGEVYLNNTNFVPPNPFTFRNKIINGDMRISQRHGSTGVSGHISGVGYPVDRFMLNTNNSGGSFGAFDFVQSTDAPEGFKYSSYLECTTASPTTLIGTIVVQFEQRIEGSNLIDLNYGTSSAKSVTVSFWIKTNKTGTYILRLYRTSPGRAIHHPIVISQSDTWVKYTHTFPGDTVEPLASDNSEGLRFTIWLVAGTTFNSGASLTPVDNWGDYVTNSGAIGNVNLADTVGNYFAITGVQLEEGPVATPFEHRPYGLELSLCQRYFQTHYTLGGGVQNSTTVAMAYCSLPVTMRKLPIINTRSGGWTNINVEHDDTYDVTAVTTTHGITTGERIEECSSFTVNVTTSGTNTVGYGVCIMCDKNGDAFTFDAEL